MELDYACCLFRDWYSGLTGLDLYAAGLLSFFIGSSNIEVGWVGVAQEVVGSVDPKKASEMRVFLKANLCFLGILGKL